MGVHSECQYLSFICCQADDKFGRNYDWLQPPDPWRKLEWKGQIDPFFHYNSDRIRANPHLDSLYCLLPGRARKDTQREYQKQ